MSDAIAMVAASLALLLVVFLVLAFRFPEVIRDLGSRTARVSIGPEGAAIEFAVRAIEEREHRRPDREQVRERLTALPARRRILWTDDSPANNRYEIEALRASGVMVDTATTNSEAVDLARRRSYVAVISDIGRPPPEAPQAGLDLPRQLKEAGSDAPVVFYVGHADAPQTPDGHPVVDRPSALFELLGEMGSDR